MTVEFYPVAERFRAIDVVEDGDRVTITATYRHADRTVFMSISRIGDKPADRTVSMSMRCVTEAEQRQVHAVVTGFFDREAGPVYHQAYIDGRHQTFRRGPHGGDQVISEHGEVVATEEMERRVMQPRPQAYAATFFAF